MTDTAEIKFETGAEFTAELIAAKDAFLEEVKGETEELQKIADDLKARSEKLKEKCNHAKDGFFNTFFEKLKEHGKVPSDSVESDYSISIDDDDSVTVDSISEESKKLKKVIEAMHKAIIE